MHQTAQVRLLLADNLPDYRKAMRLVLALDGYLVEEAASVSAAIGTLKTSPPDLVLVDLRLTDDTDDQDFSGLEVANVARDLRVPCIIMTAYPSWQAAVLALRHRGSESLAADFVSKGTAPHSMLDTIRQVLSRREVLNDEVPSSSPGIGPAVPSRGLFLDSDRRVVWLDGEQVDIYEQPYALLEYLYRKAGTVCSRSELIEAVYGSNVTAYDMDKALEGLVRRLREKLGETAANPRHIMSVKGRGFRLDL